MSRSAKPAHEYRCGYCNIIHPISMFKNTTIEGVGRECAEKKIKLEMRQEPRAISPIDVRVETKRVVEVDMLELENRVLDTYSNDTN